MSEFLYDPEGLNPRMTFQQAIDEGLLPPDIIESLTKLADVDPTFRGKLGKVCLTHEAIQDFHHHWKTIFAVRTPPIRAEEVAGWYKAEAELRLDEESIDDKKKRMSDLGFRIDIELPNPYEDWEYPEMEMAGLEPLPPREILGRTYGKGSVRGACPATPPAERREQGI